MRPPKAFGYCHQGTDLHLNTRFFFRFTRSRLCKRLSGLH